MLRKLLTGGRVSFIVFCLFMSGMNAPSVWAVSSSLWEQKTMAAFEAGEPDGVSIMAPGQILLSPKAQQTNLNARYAWSLSEDAKGRIFAGTGSDGAIFAISQKGDMEKFATLELQQVFALTSDKKGTLYAGGFPGGKIYAISPKGETSEYFDTGEGAVWALYLKSDGTLYAATGNDGRLYAIEPGGKGKLVYDSPERRLLSLMGDNRGNIYAGSDQNGIIYRFDDNNNVSVFYDTDFEEVTAMAVDQKGFLYAVSSPGGLFVKTPPPLNAPIMSKAMEAFAGMASDANNGQPSAPIPEMPAIPTAKKRSCIIYKIDENGAASKLWVSPENLIFSLAVAGENLLAGSGDEGIIYIISPTGEAGTFYKSDQKQVLGLHHSLDGSLVAALGNDAAVIRFRGAYTASGTYYSQVLDTKAVSTWGRVFWEADVPDGTQLLISTRGGNSESPDNTWSEWSPANGAERDFVSPSPPARFVQWRAVLKTSETHTTPVLHKLTLAYLQANLPPNVQSLGIDGVAPAAKPASGAAEMAALMKAMASGAACVSPEGEDAKVKSTVDGVKSAPASHESKIKIQWQAKDENDDKLQYEIYFKGADEQNWKVLKKELKETNYEWNTEAVPDGEYQIKLVVSDAPSNPADTALEGEKISDLFTIDNTAPAVSGLKASAVGKTSRYHISGTATDSISPLSSAEYSIDAGEWIPLFPVDGIFDSPSEKVEFETEELEKGEHTVALKAVDYFGNIGAGKITFITQ